MKDTSKVWDLDIITVGTVDSFKKQYPSGFRPSEMGSLTDVQNYSRLGSRDLVIMFKKDLLISTNVFTALMGESAKYEQVSAKLGRTNFFKWTPVMMSDALRHVAYPARNDNERWVRERNLNIIMWIEAQCGRAWSSRDLVTVTFNDDTALQFHMIGAQAGNEQELKDFCNWAIAAAFSRTDEYWSVSVNPTDLMHTGAGDMSIYHLVEAIEFASL